MIMDREKFEQILADSLKISKMRIGGPASNAPSYETTCSLLVGMCYAVQYAAEEIKRVEKDKDDANDTSAYWKAKAEAEEIDMMHRVSRKVVQAIISEIQLNTEEITDRLIRDGCDE